MRWWWAAEASCLPGCVAGWGLWGAIGRSCRRMRVATARGVGYQGGSRLWKAKPRRAGGGTGGGGGGGGQNLCPVLPVCCRELAATPALSCRHVGRPPPYVACVDRRPSLIVPLALQFVLQVTPAVVLSLLQLWSAEACGQMAPTTNSGSPGQATALAPSSASPRGGGGGHGGGGGGGGHVHLSSISRMQSLYAFLHTHLQQEAAAAAAAAASAAAAAALPTEGESSGAAGAGAHGSLRQAVAAAFQQHPLVWLPLPEASDINNSSSANGSAMGHGSEQPQAHAGGRDGSAIVPGRFYR